MAYGNHTVELVEMPPFQPNEYLFKTHADKGKSKWEIFAWAVRDAMSTAGGYPTLECSAYDKRIYEKFMKGRTHEI